MVTTKQRRRSSLVAIALILTLGALGSFYTTERWPTGSAGALQEYPTKEDNISTFIGDDCDTQQRQQRQRQQDPPTRQGLKLPVENVLLMGHFNSVPKIGSVKEWVEIWSRYFSKIVVTGPFSNHGAAVLRSAGISYRIAQQDNGYVSPYEHLMHVLLENEHSSSSGIEAVLYMHDDLLLNLTHLAMQHAVEGTDTGGDNETFLQLPTDRILATFGRRGTHYNISVIQGEDEQGRSSSTIKKQRLEYTMNDEDGDDSSILTFASKDALLQKLSHWSQNEQCLNQRIAMIQNDTFWNKKDESYDASSYYAPSTSTFAFPRPMQSDILLVPTKWAQRFAQAARPHIAHRVFLECAIPTILQWMTKPHHQHPAPVIQMDSLSLCTSWDGEIRPDPPRFMATCFEEQQERRQQMVDDDKEDDKIFVWQAYHPVKLGLTGPAQYLKWLDQIQLGIF